MTTETQIESAIRVLLNARFHTQLGLTEAEYRASVPTKLPDAPDDVAMPLLILADRRIPFKRLCALLGIVHVAENDEGPDREEARRNGWRKKPDISLRWIDLEEVKCGNDNEFDPFEAAMTIAQHRDHTSLPDYMRAFDTPGLGCEREWEIWKQPDVGWTAALDIRWTGTS